NLGSIPDPSSEPESGAKGGRKRPPGGASQETACSHFLLFGFRRGELALDFLPHCSVTPRGREHAGTREARSFARTADECRDPCSGLRESTARPKGLGDWMPRCETARVKVSSCALEAIRR